MKCEVNCCSSNRKLTQVPYTQEAPSCPVHPATPSAAAGLGAAGQSDQLGGSESLSGPQVERNPRQHHGHRWGGCWQRGEENEWLTGWGQNHSRGSWGPWAAWMPAWPGRSPRLQFWPASSLLPGQWVALCSLLFPCGLALCGTPWSLRAGVVLLSWLPDTPL